MVQTTDTQGTNASPSLFTTNFSTPHNFSTPTKGTGLTNKIYVFTPIGSSTRLALFLGLAFVGLVGFVGNILLLCFLKSKKKTTHLMKACSFEKNFNVYIQSLATSDVLANVIALPFNCAQIYFDVFNQGWSCKIVRYLIIVFASITMNNLLFVSVERYLSTRDKPFTFRHSTGKKVVAFAWLTAIVVVLFPAATFHGARFELSDTHYTVVCRYSVDYLPFRIMFLSYTILQYIVPGCIIIIINISLIGNIWKRMKRRIDVQRDNGIKMMRRAATIRATIIVVVLTFAFVLPYFVYFGYVTYNMVTRKTLDFETDFIIRVTSAIIAYSNSTINVIIYTVRMKEFRAFLKKTFTPRCFVQS